MYFTSTKEMERLDELAVNSGLEIRQMMELAGWQMLALFKELGIKSNKKVLIVCGRGNKGGDGLSAARHLVNHGYNVAVILLTQDLKVDPQHHLELLEKMNLDILFYNDDKNNAKAKISSADVIIDALLGYHLEGKPRGGYGEVIELINNTDSTVIAYDIPSGVETSTGKCLEPCIKAQVTLTLALPKKVFETKEGLAKYGQVYLADIGIPNFLYNQIAIDSRPNFTSQGIVKL